MAPQKLEQIINSIDRLRPMPSSVERIIRALDNPMSTASLISEYIGLDQALAATILQMANTAALGYGPSCTSLDDAVMRLGFKRIKTIVFGAAASGPLNHRLPGYRYGAGDLWNHSVACAASAQWISRALRYPNPEEAYVAGLLHDIGKLILDQFVLADYYQIIQLMHRRRLRLWQVEEELFGVNHAGVGGMASQKWHFPENLVDAIQYHHAPSLAVYNQKLASIINVANAFATRDAIGLADPEGKFVHPEALRVLQLDEKAVERMRSEQEMSLQTGSART